MRVVWEECSNTCRSWCPTSSTASATRRRWLGLSLAGLFQGSVFSLLLCLLFYLLLYHIPCLVHLINCLSDKKALVRSITCWTLSRLVFFLSLALPTVLSLAFCLNHLLDSFKVSVSSLLLFTILSLAFCLYHLLDSFKVSVSCSFFRSLSWPLSHVISKIRYYVRFSLDHCCFKVFYLTFSIFCLDPLLLFLSWVLTSVVDPGLFSHPDPDPDPGKNRIRILKEQNICKTSI